MSTVLLNGNPGSLFIDKNYLTVFGTDFEKIKNPNPPPVGPIVDPIVDPIVLNEPAPTIVRRPYYPEYFNIPYTWINIYDISKKASPKLIKNYTMAGYYSNGRKSE
jgi:hypothetical protein